MNPFILGISNKLPILKIKASFTEISTLFRFQNFVWEQQIRFKVPKVYITIFRWTGNFTGVLHNFSLQSSCVQIWRIDIQVLTFFSEKREFACNYIWGCIEEGYSWLWSVTWFRVDVSWRRMWLIVERMLARIDGFFLKKYISQKLLIRANSQPDQ